MITIDKTSYKANAFNKRIKFLVLHYTQCDFEQSLNFLTGKKVSSHYLVNNQNPNHIFELVAECDRAWHAGVSHWQRHDNINDTSIGIEIVNLGFEIGEISNKIWLPYPQNQISSVISLCRQIIERYDIKATRIIGHSDITPARKQDPGPLFPWKELYDNGIGAWYDEETFKDLLPKTDITDIKAIQQKFIIYGYKLASTGIIDSKTKDVITSFQMHFRPANFSADLDIETVAILDALITKYHIELN